MDRAEPGEYDGSSLDYPVNLAEEELRIPLGETVLPQSVGAVSGTW